MFRTDAQSRMPVMMAPDWVTSARDPGFAPIGAKVALSRSLGLMTPRQLGPTMRSVWGRAASSIAC